MTALKAVYNRLGSAPAACSWGPNRLDVFYCATDGSLRHIWH